SPVCQESLVSDFAADQGMSVRYDKNGHRWGDVILPAVAIEDDVLSRPALQLHGRLMRDRRRAPFDPRRDRPARCRILGRFAWPP
ncbi:MAG: hypothetical protein ACYCV4_07455, partial [Dermatophilaceae bacterium]